MTTENTEQFPHAHPLTSTLLESLVWRHRTVGALGKLLDLSAVDGTAPLWLAYLERTGRFDDAFSPNGGASNGAANGSVGSHPPKADRTRRAIKTRLAVHRRQIERMANVLDDVPWVVLKGEPLSVQLFGETGLRESSDVDVMVAQCDCEEAVERLQEVGYRGEVEEMQEWAVNQLLMEPTGGGLPVEVHWRIARPVIPAPETSELINRRREVALPMGGEPSADDGSPESLPVPVLAADDLLMHLAYHFHQRHGMLKGLADITAWIDRYGEERALEIRHQMRHRYGSAGLLDWALDTLNLLTGVRIGPGSDDPFVAMWSRWSARNIRRRYRDLEDTDHTMLNASENAEESAPSRVRSVARTVLGAGQWAMGMLALDRWGDKITACVRAGVLEPHYIGRAVKRLSGD